MKIKNDLVTNSSSTSYSIGNTILEHLEDIERLIDNADDDEYVFYQSDISDVLERMNNVYKKIVKLED